ncbi:MAG: archaellin/type IV pilin N-terminal domain-containing protein [archaeon]
MISNKKAVSPLIATVLLIVVAVVLTVIVLAWARTYSTDNLNQGNNIVDWDCANAAISVSNCKIDGNNVDFYVKNIGQYTFPTSDELLATLIPDVGTMESDSSNTLSTTLTPGETIKITETGGANFYAANTAISYVDVTVRSKNCTDVSTTAYNCHR